MAIVDYTTQLRAHMAAADIPSFRALAGTAGVSDWTLRQLRRGAIATIRLADLQALSQTLGLSLAVLVADFSPEQASLSPEAVASPAEPAAPSAAPPAALEQEYQRLQQQLAQQRQMVAAELQAQALDTLESWMIQWPTAAYAASQNPAVPAVRLISLIRPVEKLLAQWQVEPMAPVGAEVPYNPRHHQLMEGRAEPGDLVRIRYTGYHQGERLLHRAQVSPVAQE